MYRLYGAFTGSRDAVSYTHLDVYKRQVVTWVGQNGQSEYYNVEEYYRVRYTNTRMLSLIHIFPVSLEMLSDFTTPIETMRILKNVSTHCYMLESCLLYTSRCV